MIVSNRQKKHRLQYDAISIEDSSTNKPNTFNATVTRFTLFISRNFVAILSTIIFIQVMKGLALYQSPYARAHYLYNYDKGFIKRGLIGSVAMYLADGSPYKLLGIINFISYLSFFSFIMVLFWLITRYSKTINEKFIALLLVSSPLIIGMGALFGYFDPLFLIILMLSYKFCSGENTPAFTCFVLVIISLLIHELSVVFVVAQMIFQIWINPSITNKKKYAIISVSIFLCLLFLGLSFKHNDAFNNLLSVRLKDYAHALSTRSGEATFLEYGNYALKNNFLHDFDPHRLMLLEAFFPVYGFFILAVSIIGVTKLIRLREWIRILLFVTACYAPLIIIIVAWDVERFICLTSCTTFICYLSLSRRYKNSPDSVFKPWVYVSIMLISFTALISYYPMAEFYSEGETLISKEKQKILLQYPSRYIQGWFGNKPAEHK